MTGGQFSPTTPQGKRGTTAPYGSVERDFNVCEMAKAAGAVFVARSTTYHTPHLKGLIKQAMAKRGFAVIEVVSQCPTLFGRLNRMGDAVKMLQFYRDNSVTISQIKESKDAEGKIVIGVLHDTEAPEYSEVYKKLIETAQRK
jgi:2-oxoglutarate ferredoxin oxidoreductase subunit beta